MGRWPSALAAGLRVLIPHNLDYRQQGRGGCVVPSDGNNQLVSYDYVVLYRNITNPIIIAPADYGYIVIAITANG
jgi:hypothetical protein